MSREIATLRTQPNLPAQAADVQNFRPAVSLTIFYCDASKQV